MIRLDGHDTLYLQVYRALRQAILEGELSPGSRLPATRTLAQELEVSRNVVLTAYDLLFAEGYVEGRVGAGTFVAQQLPDDLLQARSVSSTVPSREEIPPRLSRYGQRALRSGAPSRSQGPPPKLRWDFQYGEVAPDELCMRQWRQLLTAHAENAELNYSPAEGWPELRIQITDYVRRNRGVVCDPEQVIVVNGSQQALDLSSRLLIDPGDPVVIEDPHYQGARQIFHAAGAEMVPVSVDDHGLNVARIPALARAARLLYTTPSHQFPLGAVMPLKRRVDLLDWAERNDCYVLEDDYDSEYRYEGRPMEAVQGLDRRGRTIYVGTLSKVLFPALRLGYLVLPTALVEPFIAAKWLADRQAPTLEQEVLARFIAEGHFERHLRRMRVVNAERREALLAAIDEHLGSQVQIQGTNAGVHLVLWLRDVQRTDLAPLVARAAGLGVGVYPVDPYYFQPPDQAGLVLGYASLSTEEIAEGIARLARALATKA